MEKREGGSLRRSDWREEREDTWVECEIVSRLPTLLPLVVPFKEEGGWVGFFVRGHQRGVEGEKAALATKC